MLLLLLCCVLVSYPVNAVQWQRVASCYWRKVWSMNSAVRIPSLRTTVQLSTNEIDWLWPCTTSRLFSSISFCLVLLCCKLDCTSCTFHSLWFALVHGKVTVRVLGVNCSEEEVAVDMLHRYLCVTIDCKFTTPSCLWKTVCTYRRYSGTVDSHSLSFPLLRSFLSSCLPFSPRLEVSGVSGMPLFRDLFVRVHVGYCVICLATWQVMASMCQS